MTSASRSKGEDVSIYETPTAEEVSVSLLENPGIPRAVIELAIGMARERGGGTIPVGSYDIQHARDELAGRDSENARLRAELAAVKAELSSYRAASSFRHETASAHLTDQEGQNR